MAVSFMLEEDEGTGERDVDRRHGGGRSTNRLSTASSVEAGDDMEHIQPRGGNQRRPRRKHLATEAVEAFTENEELHTKLIQLEELNNELMAENEHLKARVEAAVEARAVPLERNASVTYNRQPSVSDGLARASVASIPAPSSFDREDHSKQLNELNSKLDEKEEENEKLREKVQELESSCSELRKTLETEKQQFTAHQCRMESEQTRLQTESSELEERVASLESQLNTALNERESSREAMEQLREEMEAVQSNQMPSRRSQSISKGNAMDLLSQMTRVLDEEDEDEEDPPALEPVPAPAPREEVTEAAPTPELCSFVEGCPVPERIRGHLSKKSPSTFRSLWPYQRRLCVLERGRLAWWDADHPTIDPTECKGSLDFTSNPCCLEEDEVDLDRFSIRPLDGTWFAGSFTGANSGRVLDFSVKNSEHCRDHWMQAIRDHVEYGKKRRSLLEQRSGP